jgi:hypothetical protein
MPKFLDTIRPTPFGFYDADAQFQAEADSVVPWVKRRLGDDVISVELTSKMIWACLEEATGEATRYIHESRIKNDIVSALGVPTGSDLTNKYPRQTLEYLMRMTEPYGSAIGIGGTLESTLAYMDLEAGKQDYNVYQDLMSVETNQPLLPESGSGGRIRIIEVWHNDPATAYGSYMMSGYGINANAMQDMGMGMGIGTTYSVLPVFEDVLRRSAFKVAAHVRRSWYSYQIIGGNVRLYPTPTEYRINQGHRKLFLRVYTGGVGAYDSPSSNYLEASISGVSGMHQVPFFNIPYSTFNQPIKAWVRQSTLALCMETLGRVRSKLSSIPIPGNELRLDGPELISQANTLRERLSTEMKEFLLGLATGTVLEQQALQAEQLNRMLRFIPIKHTIMIG